MGLREYVIRRSIYMFLLVIAVVCFNFFLFRLPTLMFGVSPVDLMISEDLRQSLSSEVLQQIYLNYGLVPDPDIFDWIYMFWRYVVNMLTGNFGVSFMSQTPVMDEILARLPNTLLLMGTSSIVAIVLGIWTGVKVAADPGSRRDVGAVTVALLIYALPIFWLGMMLLMAFAFYLPNLTNGVLGLPMGKTIEYEVWIAAKDDPLGAIVIAGDILRHLILPMLTLGIGGYGGYFLYMRNNLNPSHIAGMEGNRRHDGRLHPNRQGEGSRREPSALQTWAQKRNATNGHDNRDDLWVPNKRSNVNRNGVQLVWSRAVYIRQPISFGLSSGSGDIHDYRNNRNISELCCGPPIWSP